MDADPKPKLNELTGEVSGRWQTDKAAQASFQGAWPAVEVAKREPVERRSPRCAADWGGWSMTVTASLDVQESRTTAASDAMHTGRSHVGRPVLGVGGFGGDRRSGLAGVCCPHDPASLPVLGVATVGGWLPSMFRERSSAARAPHSSI